MRISQALLSSDARDWRELAGDLSPGQAQLVLAFGLRAVLSAPAVLIALRARHPSARLVLVSTAGNFADAQIADDAVVCTALWLEHSEFECVSVRLGPDDDSAALGRELASRLSPSGLRHVLVFSDGGRVNGGVLAATFNAVLPAGVTLSGGLAGDGTDFARTVVGLDAAPEPGVVVAVGLRGDALRLGFGSAGGWSSFGPVRTVTASRGNVLERLDDRPALDLYREYLGPAAAGLPAAALRFPLHVSATPECSGVVRTILSVDDAAGTMTFAGDIPLHAFVRFMRASYEELIDGAEQAALQAAATTPAQLVLCVSCVGRRIVLGQRTEEELDGVRAAFGPASIVTGFYSYGELVPEPGSGACRLHNQTMTITVLSEISPP